VRNYVIRRWFNKKTDRIMVEKWKTCRLRDSIDRCRYILSRNRHCWQSIAPGAANSGQPIASSFYEQRQAALMVQSLLPIKPKDHRKKSALHRENIKTTSIRGYSMNTMNTKN
jgi:hypothetical protein